METSVRRALLYGGAVLALGGIGAAWSTVTTHADVTTLLSSADAQLRMAYVMPAEDLDGKTLTSRGEMISQAIVFLDQVEQAQPGMAVTAEFRGFAHMLEGEFVDAAQCYGDAQQCGDVSDEQRDILTFNQARMLAQAGELDAAMSVFASRPKALDARFGHQRRIEEAGILRRMGRADDAVQRLAEVRSDTGATAMARLQAGVEYLQLDLHRDAEREFVAVREELPIADYHLAQLKLQQGDTDNCIELLARVHAAQPAEVRRQLLQEANAWQAVSQDQRFQQFLQVSQPASPGR